MLVASHEEAPAEVAVFVHCAHTFFPLRGRRKTAFFWCVYVTSCSKGQDHSMLIHLKGLLRPHLTMYRQQGAVILSTATA